MLKQTRNKDPGQGGAPKAPLFRLTPAPVGRAAVQIQPLTAPAPRSPTHLRVSPEEERGLGEGLVWLRGLGW